MIPYTDADITITVQDMDFEDSSIRDLYFTIRQGQTNITYPMEELVRDGASVTAHMTQRDTMKFSPTTGYNAEKCEAMLNWVERISSNNYRRGSTVVNLSVEKQLFKEIVR